MPAFNDSGKTSAIVLVTLTALIMMATVALLTEPNKAKYTFNVHNSLQVIKNNLQIHLSDPVGWGYTVADPTNNSLTCIRASSNCFPWAADKNPIEVVRSIGNDIYLSNLDQANRGVGLDGRECSEFDPVNGNRGCPIKITVTWKPDCPANPCMNPRIIVEASFAFSAGSGVKIDSSKYNFTMAK